MAPLNVLNLRSSIDASGGVNIAKYDPKYFQLPERLHLVTD